MKLKIGKLGLMALMGLAALMSVAAETAAMPSEVTLTSGRVLRNVQVVRWEKDRVVLKYSGGVDPIAFSLFKSPSPAELPAMKAAGLAAAAAKETSKPMDWQVAGQVFVTTSGAGNYKFGSATVRLYAAEAIDSARQRVSGHLPSGYRMRTHEEQDVILANVWNDLLADERLLAKGVTDGDGIYSITLPAQKGKIFLVCTAGRLVGPTKEQNTWIVEVPQDGGRVDLNNLNLWRLPD